jgi:alkylation response protein AidB-like acyl-CoA dehydrogenase
VTSLADKVTTWLDDNWDTHITVREWWRRLFDAGFSFPAWPEGLGGSGRSSREAREVAAALAERAVLGPPAGHLAENLAVPTILAHGSPDQINELVRPIALGETAWCQLFSEPGSGSDLASLATKAERDGDEWIVTGQKVWSSSADIADVGMLLARTDSVAPKHRGITYFAIDMHQPGVDVRPLRTMSGASPFCEVFLTEARVPDTRRIGGLGEGWRVAQTTLAAERGSVAGSGSNLVRARPGSAGDLERTVAEVLERHQLSTYRARTRIPSGAVPTAMMIELAREHGGTSEPVLRQELARYVSQVRVNGWTSRRIAAANGSMTGADGSLAKLFTSRICQQSRELAYRIVGAHGLLIGPGSPIDGELQSVALASPGNRIGGGTDEIQLDLLGERGCNLPRVPSADRDVPYRDLEVGTRRSS